MPDGRIFSSRTAFHSVSENSSSLLPLPHMRESNFAKNNSPCTTAVDHQPKVKKTDYALTTIIPRGRHFQRSFSCPMGTTLLCDNHLIPKYYLNGDGRWSRIPYARYSPHLFGDAPFRKRRLFISGLPPETNNQNLHTYFSQFGTLDTVEVRFFRENADCRGISFVAFMSINDSEAVLNFKPHVFLGCTLEVKRASRIVEGHDIPVEDPIVGYRINFIFYEIRDRNVGNWEFRTLQKFLNYFKKYGKVLLIEGENRKGFVVFQDMDLARKFITQHFGYHIVDDYGLRAELSLHLYPKSNFDDAGIRDIFKDVREWNTPPLPSERTEDVEICSIPGFLRHLYDPRVSSSDSWNPL